MSAPALLKVFMVGVMFITSHEYPLKTAFLYNLARMVEWPAEEPHSPFPLTICLFGKDTFGDALEAIKHKKIKNRSLMFKRAISLGEVGQCHILFIGALEKNNIACVLDKVKNLPVLTVGETATFVKQGGMINLERLHDKIQIEINLQAVKCAGLTVSSRLLAIAKLTKPAHFFDCQAEN